MRWRIGAILALATLTLVVRPTAPGHMANTVAVTAPGDPDGTGNAAELSTAIT